MPFFRDVGAEARGGSASRGAGQLDASCLQVRAGRAGKAMGLSGAGDVERWPAGHQGEQRGGSRGGEWPRTRPTCCPGRRVDMAVGWNVGTRSTMFQCDMYHLPGFSFKVNQSLAHGTGLGFSPPAEALGGGDGAPRPQASLSPCPCPPTPGHVSTETPARPSVAVVTSPRQQRSGGCTCPQKPRLGPFFA